MQRLDLPTRGYQSYREAALKFIAGAEAQPKFIRLGGVLAPIIRARLKNSVLFGRPYLVCDVERSWMAQTLPATNRTSSFFRWPINWVPLPFPSRISASRNQFA